MIQNPPFYADLEHAGIQIPLDFRQMTGITFIDTILVSEAVDTPLTLSVLHPYGYPISADPLPPFEGVNFFFTFPLERDAYELDAKFRSAPAHSFDALAAVRNQLSGYVTAQLRRDASGSDE